MLKLLDRWSASKWSRINLHLIYNDASHESRLLKETFSLIKSNTVERVFIGALKTEGYKDIEKIDERREVWRVPLISKRLLKKGKLANLLMLSEWNIRLLWRYGRQPISVVQPHSLYCLPGALMFKLLCGSKVVYDCHELETERTESKGRLQKVERFVESSLIRYADAVLVVGDMIGNWYRNRYALENVVVIKNVPPREWRQQKRGNILRDALHLSNDELLFLYLGNLSRYRGIELLLSVFSKLDRNKHIIFIGYGELEKMIRNYSSKYENIHFSSAVTPNQVIKYASSADVGIIIAENACLSYYYGLSNKIFEYIMAGLPVLVSNFPEMSKLVDTWMCGWKLPHDEKAVCEIIMNIKPTDIQQKRKNVMKCQMHFGWEEEEKKLIAVYRKLLE